MYKVLKSFKGAPDGYTVQHYAEGDEVELVPDLAAVAVAEKWVKPIAQKKQLDLQPDTAVPPAPTSEE